MARSATPARLTRKNTPTATSVTAAMAAASTLSAATGTPWMMSGSVGIGSPILPGMPANTIAEAPRIRAPRPIVIMISEISGRPTSRRSTSRLKTSAAPTMTAALPPTAATRPTPSPWIPVATSREPSMSHSPRAKFIMREALYTTTKASAAGAYITPASAPSMTSATRKPSGLVLLLDLPGEPGHWILAHHRLADRVAAGDARDGHVLAALDLVEVHVHHDLVIVLADALAPDVRVVETYPLVRLGHLVGIEALRFFHRRRPEEHRVVSAGRDVGVEVPALLELLVERL